MIKKNIVNKLLKNSVFIVFMKLKKDLESLKICLVIFGEEFLKEYWNIL